MFNVTTRALVSFTLGEEIGGEGKNSRTFKAHDPQLAADIVIKQIDKSSIADAAEYFSESRALYASAHPNVVQVHYACEDNGCIYLAMPLYKRGSVRSLLATRHLSAREIVSIGCQVLTGLHNVHAKGLVHFDIKADNILLSDRGEALISDFGLAKPLNNGQAMPDGIYDPNFPPEALETTHFDATFDIFQTGLTLYCMAVGLEAYKAQYMAYFENGSFDAAKYSTDIASGTYPDRDAFPPHIPARLKKIVKSCLEVSPSDRPASALEVMNSLAKVDGAELDWTFAREDGNLVWRKERFGESAYVFTIGSNGDSTLLKRAPGGTARRVNAGCIAGIKPRQIAKVLGSYD